MFANLDSHRRVSPIAPPPVNGVGHFNYRGKSRKIGLKQARERISVSFDDFKLVARPGDSLNSRCELSQGLVDVVIFPSSKVSK